MRTPHIIIPNSFWRAFIIFFYAIVLIFLLVHAYVLLISNSPDPWLIGDWLINYQGGFVRRGLLGEGFLQLSRLSGINVVVLIIILQIILYVVFLTNAGWLSIHSTFSPLNAILIFSPAFILFAVYSQGADFRKEVLLFAFLSTLYTYLVASNYNPSKSLPIYIGVASIFIVLSHEMLVIYFPYIIAAFIFCDKRLSRRVIKITASLTPSIMVVIFLMLFGKGDEQVAIDICNSLQMNAPRDCNNIHIMAGSISSLGQDFISAHAFVVKSNPISTTLIYIFTTFLSFLPTILLLYAKKYLIFQKEKYMVFWLACCLAVTLFGTIPLLGIAADYGRIINIHITCLSLFILMMIHNKNNEPLYFSVKQIPTWLITILFVTIWRLIYWKTTIDQAFPLITMVKNLYNQ